MKNKFVLRIENLPRNTSMKDPDAIISTWFGAGLIKPASGTFGTLAAIPLGFAINYFTNPIFLLIAALVLFLGSASPVGRFGRKVKEIDSSYIVVDEVIGMWIAGALAFTNINLWIIAFLLFRFFDITKIWPASFFDKKVKNAFGVIMDDVIAGIYALFGIAIIQALVL